MILVNLRNLLSAHRHEQTSMKFFGPAAETRIYTHCSCGWKTGLCTKDDGFQQWLDHVHQAAEEKSYSMKWSIATDEVQEKG